MKSSSIFTLTHRQGDERVYRAKDGSKGCHKSICDVGYISGNAWGMLAITLPGYTEGEPWRVVNLVNQQNKYLASAAVLGATSHEHAVNMALRTFHGDFSGIATALPCDVSEAPAFVLKRLLDCDKATLHPSHISEEELNKIRDRITAIPASWHESGEILSHKNVKELVSDIVRNDYKSQLVAKVFPEQMQVQVLQGAQTNQYDSIVTQFNKLDTWSSRIMVAMGKAADKIKPVNVTTTEPFKKNGVVNIAQIYELSDGQTITIVYHNLDSIPSRLDTKDVLTSWKFLLNKRDVSTVLQPKNSKNLDITELAKRMMRIAEANSARFIRYQERKIAAEKALAELSKIEQEKREHLAAVVKEIAELKQQFGESKNNGLVDKPLDEAGVFYQSIIEGAPVDLELIQKAIKFASQDATHYLLPEATEIIKNAVLESI